MELIVAGWLLIGVLGAMGRRINMKRTLEPDEILWGVLWGPFTLLGELYRAVAYQQQDEDDKHFVP